MVYKQKESINWWYKFTWNGKLIRESTKQTNKRLAENMEAAHKSALAKDEVGIRDRESPPTLKVFSEDSFLPFVRSTRAAKPNTVRFYANSVANLSAYSKLADLPLDQVNSEIVAGSSPVANSMRSKSRPSIAISPRDAACSILRSSG